MKYLSRLCSLTPSHGVARLAVLLAVLALAHVAQATVTTVSYWRLGENDPNAGSGQICSSTTDLVGGRTLLFSPPVFWDSGSVGASAVARVGSTFGLRAYGGDSAGTNAAIPSLTDNFGLELWVNPVTLTGNQCLAYNGNSGSSGWGLYLIGNQFQGLFGGLGFVGTATATANTWTHLALVRNNGTTTLYVNGVAAGSLGTTPISPSGRFAVMGQPQNPTQERLNGFLDEVRVFTFAPGTFSTNDLLLFNTSLVTTKTDAGPGSLRWAITNLNAGGVAGDITFAVNGTITLASDLPACTNSVNIIGPGTNLLTISGSNAYRLLRLAADTTNSIGGLTLANGFTANNSSGAALYNLGYTVVTNCLFTSNSVVGGFGGAVANFGAGTLLATNCIFASNTVRGGDGVSVVDTEGGAGGGGGGMGGAVYTEGDTLTLSGCLFQGNLARGGAGGAGNQFASFSSKGLDGGFPNRGNGGGGFFANGGGGGFGGGGGGGGSAGNGGFGDFGGGGGGGGGRSFSAGGGSLGYGGAGGGGIGLGGAGGGGAGLGGAVFARAGAISILGSTFTGNQTTNGAGGSASSFSNPGSPGQGVGGAIFVLDASLTLVNPTFSGNSASTGHPNLGASTVVVNTNDSGAGSLRQAVFVANNAGSEATITFDPTLSGQTITLTSGQLTLANTVTIDASSLPNGIGISGNNASRVFEVNGGASVNLTGLTIRGGQATGVNGGGILNHGTLTLTNCSLTGNSANFGGAIYNLADALTINNCMIAGNSAVSDGGGLMTYGKAALYGSTLSSNSASAGGAIAAYFGGSPTLINCTLSGNTANPNDGGGINIYLGTAVLTNCTLASNFAQREGGGINNAGGTLSLFNTIVAGNTGATNANVAGPFSGGPNLTAGNPLLAPLGNYGGPTQTRPPLPGSSAIDGATGGTSFTTDQRGKPRLVGAFADLGAVEGVFNPDFPIVNFSKLAGGNVQFAFTNLSGPGYRVLASTNVAAPLNQWSNLGAPTEAPAGVFNFTDPGAPSLPSRFYRVTTP